jgi:hypothetical protein
LFTNKVFLPFEAPHLSLNVVALGLVSNLLIMLQLIFSNFANGFVTCMHHNQQIRLNKMSMKNFINHQILTSLHWVKLYNPCHQVHIIKLSSSYCQDYNANLQSPFHLLDCWNASWIAHNWFCWATQIHELYPFPTPIYPLPTPIWPN